jgi:hypothetical protein
VSRWPNTVTIGDFVADLDDPGDFRLTTKVEGWASPPRRLDNNDLTGRDGGWRSGGLFAARTIVHSGFVDQATPAAAASIVDSLAAIRPGALTPYTVEHESLGARQVDACVAVGIEPSWMDDRSFTYSMTLVAYDPFKRSTTPRTTVVAAGATVAVDNDGTAAADLIVTLTSSGTVLLTSGGVTLTTGTLPSGAVIDTGACTVVSSGGVDLFSSVLVPRFPALPAGGGSVHQAGTAGLSVQTFDTYA